MGESKELLGILAGNAWRAGPWVQAPPLREQEYSTSTYGEGNDETASLASKMTGYVRTAGGASTTAALKKLLRSCAGMSAKGEVAAAPADLEADSDVLSPDLVNP